MLSIFLFTFFFFVVVFGAGLAMRVLLRPSCTLHETNTRGRPEGNGLAHVIPVAAHRSAS